MRLAIDELRRGSEVQLTEDQPLTHPGPETEVEAMDALERFRTQLDALPSVHVLWSSSEMWRAFDPGTAEQLGITEGAVKMRLSRARSALAESIRAG